jgi:hypothetical protein
LIYDGKCQAPVPQRREGGESVNRWRHTHREKLSPGRRQMRTPETYPSSLPNPKGNPGMVKKKIFHIFKIFSFGIMFSPRAIAIPAKFLKYSFISWTIVP